MANCLTCDKEFGPVGRRKYCSNACKQRMYRGVGVRLKWIRRPVPKEANNNDCVPVTISFLVDKPFAAIKEWLVDVSKKVGCPYREKGFNQRAWSKVLEALGFVKVPGFKDSLLSNAVDLSDGLFTVTVRGHMFAVCDGKILDTYNPTRKYLKRIRSVYRAPVGYHRSMQIRLKGVK